ncbi:MAG: trypsin-like serine protease [Kofleriaceae bacterium]
MLWLALSLATAIVGGTDDGNDSGVLNVTINGGQCSGVAVAPYVVLTAAHCVTPGPGTVGSPPIAQTTANIVATWVDRYYDGSNEDHDIAALLVDKDQSAYLLPSYYFIAAPMLGTVTLVGWGAQYSGGERGVSRQGVVTTITEIDARTARAGSEMLTSCTGDSGGGAIYDGHSLVGIIVAGDDSCTAPAYLVRPDANPQLREVIADWTTPSSDPCSFDGTCAPDCPQVDLDCPVTGLAGATCETIYDCESRICDGNDLGHFCSELCETDADCDRPLDTCRANHCAYADGTPGIAGASCHADTDCRSMLCDRDAGTCTVPCGVDDSCPAGFTCQPVADTRACTTNSGCATTRGSASWIFVIVALAIGRRRRHARAAWQRSTASKYSSPASTATAAAPSARS